MSVSTGDMLERRTCELLRNLGYHAERVSRRSRFGTKDLFACVDIIAINAEGVTLIQSTTQSNASSHRKKIRNAALPWPVWLWKWRKERGRWIHLSEEIEAAGLSEVA